MSLPSQYSLPKLDYFEATILNFRYVDVVLGLADDQQLGVIFVVSQECLRIRYFVNCHSIDEQTSMRYRRYEQDIPNRSIVRRAPSRRCINLEDEYQRRQVIEPCLQ
jgi:hypothetical protein